MEPAEARAPPRVPGARGAAEISRGDRHAYVGLLRSTQPARGSRSQGRKTTSSLRGRSSPAGRPRSTGPARAILARDVRADGRYVSFMGWADMESVRRWKTHAEFKERMGRVQQFIDKFAPTELDVVARAGEDFGVRAARSSSAQASAESPWPRVRRAARGPPRVVLVDRKPEFAMGLRKLWELAGIGTIAEGSRPRERLGRHGVGFVQTRSRRSTRSAAARGNERTELDADLLVWRWVRSRGRTSCRGSRSTPTTCGAGPRSRGRRTLSRSAAGASRSWSPVPRIRVRRRRTSAPSWSTRGCATGGCASGASSSVSTCSRCSCRTRGGRARLARRHSSTARHRARPAPRWSGRARACRLRGRRAAVDLVSGAAPPGARRRQGAAGPPTMARLDRGRSRNDRDRLSKVFAVGDVRSSRWRTACRSRRPA